MGIIASVLNFWILHYKIGTADKRSEPFDFCWGRVMAKDYFLFFYFFLLIMVA